MIRGPVSLPLLLVATAVLVAAPLAAQQPSFDESVEVTEVLLDVLVTDNKGKVIVGLNQDDFIVEEDGQAVEVTGITFYSNRLALDETERPAEVPADRYFILFFQDQRQVDGPALQVLLRQQLQAGRRSKEWIRDEMLGGDWVAVVSYDHKLKVHQDFTQNREDLRQAIDDAIRAKDPGNIWPSRRPDDVAGDRPTLLTGLPEGKALRKATRRIYDGISVLAQATGDIQGRKSILMFTTGFGELTLGAGGSKGDPRFYPGMRQALNDNNVAVYPIDLKPPEVEGFQTSFMNQLASDTGGELYDNVVNFSTPLRQIATENNGYYLLSYRAAHPIGKNGYQQVKVTTRNRSFNVRARQGYSYGE